MQRAKNWNVYLSGEIHSDWRERLRDAVERSGLPVTLTAPVTDHGASDDCGSLILGAEESDFWKDHKGAGINAIRTRTLIEDADVVVIAYGVTARSSRHAVEMARERGRKVGFLKLETLWPFAEEIVEQAAAQASCIVVPELNLGQLVLEVERVIGRDKVLRVNRADGEMIKPAEILKAIEECEWTR